MPAGPVGPPMWLTLLEDEEDEEEEELGRPPKLILMLGRRALSPSCHSFTFKPSIELLFSAGQEGHGKQSILANQKHPSLC